MTPTIRLYARWLFRLVVILFFGFLVGGLRSKSEEEQIATINRQIAPDGHLTKTHVYIHWPAVYTQPRRNDPGGKEMAKAVTLKIPLEYMGTVLDYPLKSNKIDYFKRLSGALFIQHHYITGVYLSLLPGAKPYTPQLNDKSEPQDVSHTTREYLDSSYSVIIHRNDYSALPLDKRKPTDTDKEIYGKPPRIYCGVSHCEILFGVKGRQVIIDVTKEMNAEKNPEQHSKPNTYQDPNGLSSSLAHSGLPKWHEKVDPAQALLNSFILPEDSPEIKGMFADK